MGGVNIELEYAIKCLETGTKMPDFYASNEDVDEACKIACEAIKEKVERNNPQPLAEDELRGMEGQPVWIHTFSSKNKKTYISEWALVASAGQSFVTFARCRAHGRIERMFSEYGKTWIAYKYKPKEE